MACTPQRAFHIGELCGSRLDAAGATELLDHLERCDACSQELDMIADLLLCGERAAPAEPGFSARRLRMRLVLGAVATAAAAVLLVLVMTRDGTERRIRGLARLAPPPAAGLVLRGEPDEEVAGSTPGALREAMRHFTAGDFALAAERLALLAQSSPDDPLALFYLGLARLQLAADENALAALERAASLGEGLLAEQALWYAANAHLARGEGELARAALLRLVELDGDYEPNARSLLSKLEPLLSR